MCVFRWFPSVATFTFCTTVFDFSPMCVFRWFPSVATFTFYTTVVQCTVYFVYSVWLVSTVCFKWFRSVATFTFYNTVSDFSPLCVFRWSPSPTTILSTVFDFSPMCVSDGPIVSYTFYCTPLPFFLCPSVAAQSTVNSVSAKSKVWPRISAKYGFPECPSH